MKKSNKVKGQLSIFDKEESGYNESEVVLLMRTKKYRMKVFKWVFKHWGDRDDEMAERFNKAFFQNNPEVRNQIWLIRCGIEAMGTNFGLEDIKKVHKEFWPRIVKYVLKKVKANGGYFPELGYTETLKLALHRGFIHTQDLEEQDQRWYIYCLIAPLVWPIGFDEQTDALQKMSKVGIPGRTGVKKL